MNGETFPTLDDVPQPSLHETHVTAYTMDGHVVCGVYDWEMGETTWGDPEEVAIGTVIHSGYDFYTNALPSVNWRWNGETWEATDDE